MSPCRRLAWFAFALAVLGGWAGADGPRPERRPPSEASVADQPPERPAQLSPALRDPDPAVRLRAVSTLVRDASPAAMDALAAAALFDGAWSVRQDAVIGLGEVGGEAHIPILEQAFLDPEVRVREAVVDAIADIGGDQAALAMCFALNDDETSLREDAMYALGDIGGPIAIEILRSALKDEERSVRETAEELLSGLAAAGGKPAR